MWRKADTPLLIHASEGLNEESETEKRYTNEELLIHVNKFLNFATMMERQIKYEEMPFEPCTAVDNPICENLERCSGALNWF